MANEVAQWFGIVAALLFAGAAYLRLGKLLPGSSEELLRDFGASEGERIPTGFVEASGGQLKDVNLVLWSSEMCSACKSVLDELETLREFKELDWSLGIVTFGKEAYREEVAERFPMARVSNTDDLADLVQAPATPVWMTWSLDGTVTAKGIGFQAGAIAAALRANPGV